MNAVKEAIVALTKLPKLTTVDSEVRSSIQQLSSLLNVPTLSPGKSTQLSNILRTGLQPLYRLDVPATLALCVAILELIHKEKVLPLLKGKDRLIARPWEAVEVALLSGMLDFLEVDDSASREPFANAINPIICASFFENDSSQIVLLDENLLTIAYQFLTEMLEARKKDANSLRGLIGSCRLGQTIFRIKDFLALEGVLNVLGKLNRVTKKNPKQHMVYLAEVFNPSVYKCGSQILKLLHEVNTDWNTVTVDIMRVLAAFDKSFPQLFSISGFTVGSSPLSVVNPFVIDKVGFTGTLEQDNEDGTLRSETLQIPYSCVQQKIRVVALSDNSVAVEVMVTRPPVLGGAAMGLPARESYKVRFQLKKKQKAAFVAAIKHRKLEVVYPAVTSKLSQATSELLEGIENHEEPMTWMNKAKFLARMASPSKSVNPGNDEEDCDDASAPSGSDEIPKTVFVQRDGTLSKTKVKDEHLPSVIDSSNSETDDVSEYQPTLPPKEKVADAAKKPAKATYSNGRQAPTAAKMKEEDKATKKPPKRTLQAADIEDDDASTAKRRRLSVTQSPAQNLPKAKGRRSSMSKPVTLDDSEDLPEPPKVPPKPRARAMKGKNGKPAAPAKPFPAKKLQKQVEVSSDPVTVESSEPVKENVKRRSLRSSTAQTTKQAKKPEKLVSKKVKKAPWEEADFSKLKEEPSDHVFLDDLGPDPVISTDHEASDTMALDKAPFGDKYVDSMEPTRGITPVPSAVLLSSPARPPPLKKEVITIDLTNSPPIAVNAASLKPAKMSTKPLGHLPVYSLVKSSDVCKDGTSTKSSSMTFKAPRIKSPVRHEPHHSHPEESMSKQIHRQLVPATQEHKFHITGGPKSQASDEVAIGRLNEVDSSLSRLDEQRCISKARITERRPERLPSPPPPPTKVSFPYVSDDDSHHRIGRPLSPPLQNRRRQQDEKASPLHLKSTPPSRRTHEFRKNFASDHGHGHSRGQDSQYEMYSVPKRGRPGRRQLDNHIQEDPMDKIAAILAEITDVIIHRTETKFTSIPKELRMSEAQARQQFVNGMKEVNNKLVRHYNAMFDLDAEYSKISADILEGLRNGIKASNEMALACKQVIQDFNRNSVRKKFSATLAPDRPSMAILADPSLGFSTL